MAKAYLEYHDKIPNDVPVLLVKLKFSQLQRFVRRDEVDGFPILDCEGQHVESGVPTRNNIAGD